MEVQVTPDLKVNAVKCYISLHALEAGDFVDITETAEVAGIQFTVLMSRGIWQDIYTSADEEISQRNLRALLTLCHIDFESISTQYNPQESYFPGARHTVKASGGGTYDLEVYLICMATELNQRGQPALLLMQPRELQLEKLAIKPLWLRDENN